MNVTELTTKVPNTWCPGCTNFMLMAGVKKAVTELVNEGVFTKEQFTTVAGIGCHAKIYDYLNLSGFYGLHGRVPPVMAGLKLANPNLKVLGFSGDGDAFAEGMSHFIHFCRYNLDATYIIHNNQIFALTTGQVTPTTEPGAVTKSTPHGSPFRPINPITLALESGATFVAREYALDLPNLSETLKRAMKHKGASVVEILQPCITFKDVRDFVKDKMFRIEPSDLENAVKTARGWNYTKDDATRIPVGVFYETQYPTLEEKVGVKVWHEEFPKREHKVEELWARFK
ncbi:MAG: 2-oxoacid:ferredoxin oxidoreductase subunit beta [Candidatus Altiarchaeota archaeon]|nr:2-oxoacid:ferredoxin oxidoreductase subunit beta [Candidatus Altiarchaeota archaeon]